MYICKSRIYIYIHISYIYIEHVVLLLCFGIASKTKVPEEFPDTLVTSEDGQGAFLYPREDRHLLGQGEGETSLLVAASPEHASPAPSPKPSDPTPGNEMPSPPPTINLQQGRNNMAEQEPEEITQAARDRRVRRLMQPLAGGGFRVSEEVRKLWDNTATRDQVFALFKACGDSRDRRGIQL